MELFRKEIRTGLLVIVTLAALVLALLAIGAPGVLKKVNTYRIYFDNAAGLKPGAQVLLAGRAAGVVTKLFSPVAPENRPQGFEKYEAMVEVQMERRAKVYRHVSVQMQQLSMLGDQIIDFANGDPASGIAANGEAFIGERVPDFSEAVRRTLEEVKPVAAEATRTLKELQKTAANLNRLTAEGSEFETAIGNFRQLGDNLMDITAYGSPLRNSLDDFNRMTGDLNKITEDLVKNERIKLTLQDFQATAEKFRQTGDTLDRTVKDLRPGLIQTTANARDMTDTLKRQPWRLLWPTTKKYPEDRGQAATSPTPRRR